MIKDYNPISKRYCLGLPNEEVRSAFINSLVQNFASITEAAAVENQVVDFSLGVEAPGDEGRGKGVLCSYRCSLGKDY